MCGIFGVVGLEDTAKITLQGIRRLEYRGYDSAGLVGFCDGVLLPVKSVGKIANLENKLLSKDFTFTGPTISQTRWATHGEPSDVNAHPHLSEAGDIALVHNGIIENHDSIRKRLQKQGVVFQSQTDTETIVHLIAEAYKGDFLVAVQQALAQAQGAYAIAVVHKAHPDQIIVAARQCPMALGIGEKAMYVSSDPMAFADLVQQVVYLDSGEVAVVRAKDYTVYDQGSTKLNKLVERFQCDVEGNSKGKFQHFMLKEIHEQPQTIRNALLSRYVENYGTAVLENFHFDMRDMLAVERILILACGTSGHAGMVASYMIEEMCRIPVQVEISSEYRYKNPIVSAGTLVIAISQSGETADTLAAMRECKEKGAKVLGICNRQGSTLAREADSCLFLRAGTEIGVASTKAYTAQVVVLALFSLMMARMRHMSKEAGIEFVLALKALPDAVQAILRQEEAIKATAEKYAHYENFFFLGRKYMFPAALEGALKLKEISYVNANGYPAGEMKHGPIALINPACPTVALCASKSVAEKTLSNLMEVKARKGLVLAIAEEGQHGVEDVADDIIWVPKTLEPLAPILSGVVCQLFSYYVALKRQCEIDQPRNLAKSVTVE